MKHKGDNQWLFSQLKGVVGMQALQGFQLYAQQVMPQKLPALMHRGNGHPSSLDVMLSLSSYTYSSSLFGWPC